MHVSSAKQKQSQVRCLTDLTSKSLLPAKLDASLSLTFGVFFRVTVVHMLFRVRETNVLLWLWSVLRFVVLPNKVYVHDCNG